jgi:hypothetical protein
MPTTITAPSNSLAKIRFQEQYVSEGLNKKLNGIAPSGIIRGGNIITAASGLNITVEADANTGDSIYSYIDTDGHQLTFRQVGNVNLDLAAAASTTVYVCLYVDYSIGVATVIEWRTYTVAELITAPVADAPFLIVLGQVVVPGSGPIAAGAVTPLERREAWQSVSQATRPWHQIVENGRFDVAKPGTVTADSAKGWLLSGLVGGSRVWSIATGAPSIGLNELQVAGGAGFSTVDTGDSAIVRPISPGDKVRVSYMLRGASWGSIGASGVQGVRLTWLDGDRQSISTTDITDNSLNGTFGYTEISQIVLAPALAEYVTYAIRLDPDSSTPTGDLFFDDIRVWVQADAVLADTKPQRQDSAVAELFPDSGFTDMAGFVDMALRAVLDSGTAAGEVTYNLERMGAGGTGFVLDLLVGAIKALRVKDGTELGVDLNTTVEADHDTARVVTNHEDHANITRTLLWEMNPTTPTSSPDRVGIRLYHVKADLEGGDNAFEITINAFWANATDVWAPDDAVAAQNPTKLTFSYRGLQLQSIDNTIPATWTDAHPDVGGGWDFNVFSVNGMGSDAGDWAIGLSKLQADDGTLHFSNPTSRSNPAATASTILKNTIYAKSMVKAWGRLSIPATAGAGAAVTINDGFNIKTAVTGGAAGVNLDFTEPMGSSSYTIVASTPSATWEIKPSPFDTDTIFLQLIDTTDGSTEDTNNLAGIVVVMFAVLGEQT